MPKFFNQHIFSSYKPILDPNRELPSPLDTPELPSGVEDRMEPDQPYHHPQQSVGYEDYLYDVDNLYNTVHPLLTWRAASRPFRKKDRSYYTTVIILIALISMIAFLAGERLLIGVLFALLFLIYVLNFTPPEDIDYKLSTQGITIGDHFYHWYELDSFWFSQKDGFKVLNVLTRFRFPGLLIIVLGQTSEEEVKRVSAKYLPFHEIAPKSIIEKWTESLQKHFPLENPHK